MSGRAVRFTQGFPDMVRVVLGMREFVHIHGRLAEAFNMATDQEKWDREMLAAYNNALPLLIWSEHSTANSEQVLSRDRRIKPTAMLRRLGFLYGQTCL